MSEHLEHDRGTDGYWLALAVELAGRCPPSATAYSVGAVIVDAGGRELARGWSRETDTGVHAEESALAKLDPRDPRLRTATLYSSLEPCTRRASRPRSCARLVLDAAIPRVVIAWREPALFVADAGGSELLGAAGVDVVRLAAFEAAAMAANAHLPLTGDTGAPER